MFTKIVSIISFFGLCLLYSKDILAQPKLIDIAVPKQVENIGNTPNRLVGPHGKIVQKILDKSENKITHRIMSPQKAYSGFHKKKFTCVTPDSISYYNASEYDFIESKHVNSATWVILQKKGDTPIENQEGFKGKRVGTLYQPEELYNIIPQKGVDYVYSTRKKSLFKMLSNGSLDFVVITKLELEKKLHDTGYTNLTFNISPPLATVPNTVMCHNNERGVEIIKLVNEALSD